MNFIASEGAMNSDGQMDVDTVPSSSKGKGKAAESSEPRVDETLPWLRFPPSALVSLLTYLTGWRSTDQSPWTMLFHTRTLQRQVEFFVAQLLHPLSDFSCEVHREEPLASPSVLWSTWNWEDIHDSCGGKTNLWNRI
jgi:hypothetical protein